LLVLRLLAQVVHEPGDHFRGVCRRSNPKDRLRKGLPIERAGALRFEESGDGRDGCGAQLHQRRGQGVAVARQQVDQVRKDRQQAVGRQG
jgi:hypothetical protein